MPSQIGRWQWVEMFASGDGPASPTTRHVLHAIAKHMNSFGDNAFPGKARLAECTGLSERAITKHIGIAQRTGWLEVGKRHRSGRGWRGNTYHTSVPVHLTSRVPKSRRGREQGAPHQQQRREPENRTGGTSFHDRGNEVPTNSSVNISLRGEVSAALNGTGGRKGTEEIYGPRERLGPADQQMFDRELERRAENQQAQAKTMQGLGSSEGY